MGRDKIYIGADSRIELLSIVQLFTSWKIHGIVVEDSFFYPYKRSVIEWFNPYRGHQAVKVCQKLVDIGFTFDAPVGFVMHLSEPPELRVVKPFSKYHIGRAQGENILREFVEQLRDFADKSRFIDFWESQKDFYQDIVVRSEVKVDEVKKILEQLKEFFRVRGLQCQVYTILAPLIREGFGYGYRLENSLFSFIGPLRFDKGFPIFGGLTGFKYLLRHEYAHLFVNTVTAKYREMVDKYAYLFEDIKERMRRLAYGDWETALNEHIIRACEAIFREIYEKASKENIKSYLKNQEHMGFKYIWKIYRALKEYLESNLSFEKYYPRLLTHLKCGEQ